MNTTLRPTNTADATKAPKRARKLPGRRALAAAALVLTIFGMSSPAHAAAGISHGVYDSYGNLVNTPAGRVRSSDTRYNSLTWDTNGQYVTVKTSVLDTGKSDGQVAGLYANLLYTDGTYSGYKPVFETGNQVQRETSSRRFVPTKRVSAIYLTACRRSSAAGINACGTVQGWDNPYT